MRKLVALQKALQVRLILAATLPLLLVGLTTLAFLNRQLSDSILKNNSTLAEVAGEQANEVFRDSRLALKQFAALQGHLTDKTDADLDTLLTATIETVPFFEFLYVLDRQGRIRHLGLPKKFADLGADYLGGDHIDRARYRATLEQGSENWSDPYLSAFTRDYAIALSLPFQDGALVGICGLDRLQGLVGTVGRRGAVTATILDRSGGVVYESQSQRSKKHRRLGSLEPVRAALQGRFGTAVYRLGGKSYLGSTAPIPETGWVLMISQDEKTAFAAVRQTLGLILVGMALALGVAAMIASTVARRLSRPLGQLQRQAEAFASSGDPGSLPPQPWLEMEALAESLKRMVATVRGREMELDRSRAHYRMLFDNGTDAIFIHGLTDDGNPTPFREVNGVTCEWLEMNRKELLRLTPRDIDGEIWSDPDEARKVIEGLTQEGQIRFETSLRSRSGRLIPVEINSRLFDLDEAPAILSVARDVSVRRKKEAELLGTHKLLTSIVDTSPVAIIVLDREERVVLWNPAAERIFGWSAAEVLGDPLPTIPEHLHDEARQDFAVELAGNLLPPRNLHRLHKSGRHLEVRAASAPLKDAGGEVIGVIAMLTDITTERQVEEERRKLALAVEQSPVCVVITDLSGSIEYVNPAFTNLTGYSQEEARGQNPRILKSGATPPETFAQLWQTIAAGKVWQGEFCNQRKDGELFWERAIIAPMTNADGIVTHYIGIKENISERRRLEEQLRMSQRLESLGTLTGGIAHDFNNLLTAVTGYGSLLKMRLADQPQLQTIAGQILEIADRGASLTRNLLVLGRREPGQSQPFEINNRLTKLGDFLARVIRSDIELRLDLAPEPLVINGDGPQLDQVLINLATNARDAMAAGGQLRIGTRPFELDEDFVQSHGFGLPGSYALLTVADTGCGMGEELQRKIFDPFFTTKEVGKGTGLGLAICYGIIKQHRGFINVYSEPGRGTTFRIYLPRAMGREVTGSVAAEPAPICSGVGQTLLLVEDNAAVRQSLAAVLEAHGYRVIAAENAVDALKFLQTSPQKVELVLTDIIMPGMNGYELGSHIRRFQPKLPLLYMSGYTGDALAPGDDAVDPRTVLGKPVQPRELLTRVYALLNP